MHFDGQDIVLVQSARLQNSFFLVHAEDVDRTHYYRDTEICRGSTQFSLWEAMKAAGCTVRDGYIFGPAGDSWGISCRNADGSTFGGVPASCMTGEPPTVRELLMDELLREELQWSQ